MTNTLRSFVLATTAFGLILSMPAHAADKTGDALKSLQQQVAALQKQINALQVQQNAAPVLPASGLVNPLTTSDAVKTTDGLSKEVAPGVKVTLGGYIEANAIWRDKSQMNGSASNFNAAVPFQNSPNYYQNEFTGTARSSRITLAMDGKLDKEMLLSGYLETDFQAAAVTSNDIQTNSYVPRMRQGFVSLDHKGWGMKFLAGQAWSMATMNRVGITERKENGPIVIDVGGIPGYTNTRNTQFRVVKGFNDNKLNVGLSFEMPEVNFGGVTPPSSVLVATATGVSPMNTLGQYSTDVAPDIIGKVAYDSSIGHFEAFGLTRFFHTLDKPGYDNNVEVGYGGGASAFVPVLDKKLDILASFMGGKGIGRYNMTLMPDLSFGTDGSVTPVTQISSWIGLVGHPTPSWDLYTYAGIEKVMRENENATGYGYGYAAMDNSGCYVKGGTCTAQTQSTWQVTPGFWYSAYKGTYGNLKLGAQYSLTRRDAFSGLNDRAPHAFENVVMTSVKYSPF